MQPHFVPIVMLAYKLFVLEFLFHFHQQFGFKESLSLLDFFISFHGQEKIFFPFSLCLSESFAKMSNNYVHNEFLKG